MRGFQAVSLLWIVAVWIAGLCCTRAGVGIVSAIPAPILWGQTSDLTGSSMTTGVAITQGIQAAFLQANVRGGLPGGRNITLLVRDSKYNATRAGEDALYLVAQGVIGFVGSIGTDPSTATKAVAEANQLAFVGPWSGAQAMRTPYHSGTVNIRPSYRDEIAGLVSYLMQVQNVKRFAVLHANDGFGRDGRDGLITVLEKYFLTVVATQHYDVNGLTSAIMATKVEALLLADPEAIVLIATRDPAALAIIETKKRDRGVTFCCLSVAGDLDFIQAVGADASSVIIAQSFPDAANTPVYLQGNFTEAMAMFDPTITSPSKMHKEGYFAGRLIVEATRRLPSTSEVTAREFMSQFVSSTTFDVDGLTFGPIGADVCSSSSRTSCGCNESLRRVYVSRIHQGVTKYLDYVFEYATCGFKPMTARRLSSDSTSSNLQIITGVVGTCFIALLVMVGLKLYLWLRAGFVESFRSRRM